MPSRAYQNRILLMDRIERALERARRFPDYQFAVLFLDLDHFKLVNDSLGHLIGDQLLTAFARRLQACVQACDTIARWSVEPTIARLGGDEFTILLEGIKDSGNAILVGERIQKELAKPFNLSGREVFTTASIGITVGGPEYHRPEELLRDADTAMYGAKATGKARHEVFDTTMRARAIARLEMETELRRALEASRVSVVLPTDRDAEYRATDRFRGAICAGSIPTGDSSSRTSSSPPPKRTG